MQIYSPTLKGPLKISGFIDPDDTTQISVYWNAPEFSAESVYRLGDVLRPTVDNGYYYQCTVNGVAGTSEPIWTQEETISGTATFTAVPWNLWLLPNQTIIDSIWAASNNIITLSQDTFTDYKSTVFVSTVPADLIDFELTNQIFKDNGESISRSFLYKVNQQ
jgi:hypothetical protein